MDRLTYPARVEDNRQRDAEDWGYTVTFRDLPEAITCAAIVDEVDGRAADCLWTALAHRMRTGQDLPRPSPAEHGERAVTIDDLLAAKAVLYALLKEQGLGVADLSRRLNIKEREAAALLDPASRPPIARLERALASVGKRLVFDVRDAA